MLKIPWTVTSQVVRRPAVAAIGDRKYGPMIKTRWRRCKGFGEKLVTDMYTSHSQFKTNKNGE